MECDQCTKLPIFSIAEDAFSFSQHSKKPYNKKNLTEKEFIFNYRSSIEKNITRNVNGIWINRFKIFTAGATLTQDKA